MDRCRDLGLNLYMGCVYGGLLYFMTDFSVMMATGSGGDIALGALEAFNIKALTKPESVEKVVRKAIQIATQWDIYTAEPIVIKIQHSM